MGTNDLTQYTLAASRDDASVNDYYLDSHESILRLLRIILTDATGRPVSLCGELAGREAMVPRLLEMGFRSLSIAPSLIPTTKALIRTIRLDAATNGPKQPGGNMNCEHAAKVKPVPPAYAHRMRGVPGGGDVVGSPAFVSDVRPRRLL